MINPFGRRTFLQQSTHLTKLAVLLLFACGSTSNSSDSNPSPTSPIGKSMKLESSAFAANGTIPSSYTCDGENSSPPLQWDEPPARTQSLALIVDDPDAPFGTFVHWVLYNLPAEIRQLSEGVASEATLPNGAVQGKNDFRKLGYGGPCPPGGTHRYFFRLYVLDSKVGLAPGATKQQLEAAMNGHVLGSAELVGRYSRS